MPQSPLYIPPAWHEGHLEFFELLKLNPSFTVKTLAKVMGFPRAEQIVSIRHVFNTWPVYDHQRIMAARFNYDAGHSELTTGRYKSHFLLYETPRKVRSPYRRDYFSAMGNGVQL